MSQAGTLRSVGTSSHWLKGSFGRLLFHLARIASQQVGPQVEPCGMHGRSDVLVTLCVAP